MTPVDWNVVVVAAWNRAILTPAWMARVVLGLQPDAPLDVMVPLDTSVSFQVRHGGLIVTPLRDQLLVQLETPSVESLASAKTAMKRALADLPRTPLMAVGINIRFLYPEPGDKLLAQTRCASEMALSASGYEIRTRRRGETMAFKDGTLNFIADIPTTGQTVLTFNFERQCTAHDDAHAWLDTAASEYAEEASRVRSLIAE